MVVQIIEMKDVSFSFGKEKIFDKLNLTFDKGTFTTIAGSNGSGKSTLLKLIDGFYSFKGTILVDQLQLSDTNRKEIRKKIGMIFDNPDLNFVTETVEDEIVFPMENLRFSREMMEERLLEVLELFQLEEIREYSVHQLSGGQKQLVSFAASYALMPDILLLDEAFSMIDFKTKEKILKIMKKLQKKGTTIIQVTNDLEESIYSDRIILLNNGKIVGDGSKSTVLCDEKLLRKAGLEPPFMADLSIKLKYYGLVDDPIFEPDRMVNHLWK